jgi:hypothetical protein
MKLSATVKEADVMDEFGIVATITRVSKPMFKGSAELDSGDDFPTPQITIEPGDAVVAAGTCSDVIRLGSELSANKQMEPSRR